ncbi:MAG: hypothetical protein KJ749_15675 [Planctomycetes bacterium]|nr:hypothetical protein [Planctomycetota bacterium]
MRAVIGSVLILAASVLVGSGIIAHDIGLSTSDHAAAGTHAAAGYFLGGLLAVIGIAVLMAGPLKRGWDAIPVDEKKPKTDE